MLSMLRGTGSAFWLPGVANLEQDGTVTFGELAAGLDISAAFNQIQGLARQRNPINVPVMKYKTELQIAGPEQFQAIAITLIEDDGTGVDADSVARQAAIDTMEEGTQGVLVIFRFTQAPTAGSNLIMIAGSIDDQEPNIDLGATAQSSNINITAGSPLFKGTLVAGS